MFKFPTAAVALGWRGIDISVHPSQVWSDDDPFVKAHPELFSDVPAVLERSDGAVRRGIEQATAGPGEKRNVR